MNQHYFQPDPQIDGWMNPLELQWLYEQAQRMQSIVEVGSWKGRSTHALLSGCKGLVYAVDHFRGSESQIETVHKEAKTTDIYAQFIQNVGHFKNLYVLKKESIEASTLFSPHSIDMVFIDGDHEREAFQADLEAWGPIAKVLLCGHDRDEEGVPLVLRESGLAIQDGEVSIWYVEKWQMPEVRR